MIFINIFIDICGKKIKNILKNTLLNLIYQKMQNKYYIEIIYNKNARKKVTLHQNPSL